MQEQGNLNSNGKWPILGKLLFSNYMDLMSCVSSDDNKKERGKTKIKPYVPTVLYTISTIYIWDMG